MKMGALYGKVAVITGGNSGIGLATAKRFVKEGAYVFITGRRQAELDAAVSLIGKNVTAVQGDVSNLDDLDRLYEVVRKVKGHVDIVFANAGVVEPVSLAESTPETFDKHFNLNARGAYFTVQKALPLLANKASIILSGSAAWQMGIPGYGAYSATKAALVSFVRSWTAELASRGLVLHRVNPHFRATVGTSGNSQIETVKAFPAFSEIPGGPRPYGSLNLGEKFVVIGVFLLKDADVAFSTGDIHALTGGVVIQIVRILDSRKCRNQLA
jgi:NAD(P)-dependent dehydrogenase (short-subunit alcohol dehydrogenase family)